MTADLSGPDDVLASALDELAFKFGSLAALLDEEAAAAQGGDSGALRDCHARKLELTRAVEQGEAELRELLGRLPADLQAAVLTPERRTALVIARQRLQGAIARNEATLRAVGEAIRRIFEGAARAVAEDAIGYGPGRIAGDGRLFAERTA